jgi:hypothetical protein
MKYFYCFILTVLLSQNVYAQQWSNPENARLTNTITNFMNQFGGGGLPIPAPVVVNYDPYSDYQNGYYQELQNSLTRTEIYFQKRQTNMYYRELEVLQKKEIKELKKDKQLTIPELNRIFGKDNRY